MSWWPWVIQLDHKLRWFSHRLAITPLRMSPSLSIWTIITPSMINKNKRELKYHLFFIFFLSLHKSYYNSSNFHTSFIRNNFLYILLLHQHRGICQSRRRKPFENWYQLHVNMSLSKPGTWVGILGKREWYYLFWWHTKHVEHFKISW